MQIFVNNEICAHANKLGFLVNNHKGAHTLLSCVSWAAHAPFKSTVVMCAIMYSKAAMHKWIFLSKFFWHATGGAPGKRLTLLGNSAAWLLVAKWG